MASVESRGHSLAGLGSEQCQLEDGGQSQGSNGEAATAGTCHGRPGAVCASLVAGSCWPLLRVPGLWLCRLDVPWDSRCSEDEF